MAAKSPLDSLLQKNIRGGDNTIINRGINTTGSKMYFVNIDTGGRLEIQFIPEGIQHNRSGNWAEAAIIGRNDPRFQYVCGQTDLRFTLDFYADEQSRTSVMRKVQWLHSLIANDKGRRRAPRIILVMGEMFKKEVWIVGSAKAEYSNLSKPNGFLPQQAYVDIELKLDPNSNTGWSDIRNLPFVSAPSDGENPIDLGRPNLGQTATYSPNRSPTTRPYLGTREADDIDVGSGNDWRSILKRVTQRYRLPGNLDLLKDPGFNPGRISEIGG